MSFLFDPNIAFLLLVLGFMLGVLALITPGTGLLEIGALFTIFAAGYAMYHLTVTWWALVLFIAGVVPLVLAIRKSHQWYWLIPALAFFIVGSLFLFPQNAFSQSVNPVFAIFMSMLSIAILWFIGRKGVDAMKMKPVQDLKQLVGQVGEALTEIKGKGTVYVGGEEWSARSSTVIYTGSEVKVIRREGLVLIVEPVAKSE